MTALTTLPSLWKTPEIIERFFDDSLLNFSKTFESFLPYNLYQDENGNLVYEMALAGYDKSGLSVTYTDSHLTIECDNTQIIPENAKWVKQGIARRKFKYQIPIPSTHEAGEAELVNGLLKVTLRRNPENVKQLSIK